MKMFSLEDLRDLVRLFPPFNIAGPSVHPHSNQEGLLPRISNNGYVKSSSVSRALTELDRTGPSRIGIAELTERFDLSRDTLISLIQKTIPDMLLSKDEQYLVPLVERSRILNEIHRLSSNSLTSITDCVEKYDINARGLDSLIVNHNNTLPTPEHPHYLWKFPASGDHNSAWFYSQTYWQKLRGSVLDAMQVAQINAESLEFTSNSMLGQPPMQFLLKVATDVLSSSSSITGRMAPHQDSADAISFQPTSNVLRERDRMIQELAEGQRLALDVRWLTDSLGDAYPKPIDAMEFVQGMLGDRVVFFSYTAVSVSCIDKIVETKVRDLLGAGYADIPRHLSQLPDEVANQVIDLIAERILIAANTGSKKRLGARRWHQYIFSADWHNRVQEVVLRNARRQAMEQWIGEDTKGLFDSGFQASVVRKSKSFKNLNLTQQLDSSTLDLYLRDSGLQDEAKVHFNEILAQLEEDDEAQFASLWSERVTGKLHLYRLGLDAIADEKLRGQLFELLESHISIELVPDTLSKAKLQSVMRSERTQRNVHKLKLAMAPVGGAGSSGKGSVAAVEKFMSKQGLKWLDEQTLSKRKQDLVQELVKGMQRDEDGPRLFLTAVVVLFAARNTGVVYATGKFAPRLLKVLKGLLNSDLYSKLEELKDAVKAGSLTLEDKEAMRAIASESTSFE